MRVDVAYSWVAKHRSRVLLPLRTGWLSSCAREWKLSLLARLDSTLRRFMRGGTILQGLSTRPVSPLVPLLSTQVFAVVLEVESCIAGCALYLQAATANHSCAPNAVQSFDGRVLSLRCIRPIMKGEEITVGIIELHRHSAARQQSLRTSYFFECQCDRCSSEGADAEDARLTGYACPDKRCPGVCANRRLGSSRERSTSTADEEKASSAVNTLPESDDSGCLLCSTCGAPRSAEDADRESRAIDELNRRGKAFCSSGKELEGKLVLEEALQRGINCLHRGNWVLSDLFAELSSVCVHLQVRHIASATRVSSPTIARSRLRALGLQHRSPHRIGVKNHLVVLSYARLSEPRVAVSPPGTQTRP